MHSRLEAVKVGSHILAIYPSREKKLEEAFEFLKAGFDANEAVVLISNDITKDEARKMISTKWKIDDIEGLEAKGDIMIITTKEAYFPEGKIDNDKIIAQWNELVGRCVSNGTNGLKAFCMMDCFFENDFAEEVVDYEHTLPAKFDMPFVPICAYRKQDIDKLSEDQLKRLLVCHSHVWTNNK